MAMIAKISPSADGQKSKIKILHSGFTLMEMLVTVLIFAVLGTLATISLYSLLKGASKAERIKELKQNGDYALSVMEVKIRNSKISDANCIGIATTSLIIQMQDNAQTLLEYSCASNQVTERQIGSAPPQASPTLPNYLTNTSVNIPTCTTADFSLTCANSSATGQKSVSINFRLIQSQTLPASERVEERFQTQVSLRNK